MTIDCVDSADDSTEISDFMDGIGCESTTPSWNGRDVELATEKHYRLALIAQFYAATLQQINNAAALKNNASRYELLDLEDELIEKIAQDFERYAEANHLFTFPHGREFTLADFAQFQAEIIHCKSLWKRVGDGFVKAGKGTAKATKKTGKALKRGAEKTVDFVKDHKKEVLIVAGAAIAVAVGAFALAGTLGGAALAANGIDASPKKREDEEDPHAQPRSNDPPTHKNPPPVGVLPPTSNPATDPHAVTHFLEGLRTGKIKPVEKPLFDMSYKGQSNATPPPIAPPSTSNPVHNPNALHNFLEGLRTGKIEPVSKPVFDLSRNRDSSVTVGPVAPLPIANAPVDPNALNNFIESLRSGKFEAVAKPVFDLSHKSQGATAMTQVVPPVSTPSSKVSAHFTNAITTPLENLRSGKMEPTSKPSFDLSFKSNSSEATAPVAPLPIGNPETDLSLHLKSAIAYYLETLQRSAIDQATTNPSPKMNPSPEASGFIQSAITKALDTLGRSVSILHPHLASVGLFPTHPSSLVPLDTGPLISCYAQTEGIAEYDLGIAFVNGMNTSFQEHKSHLYDIKRFSPNFSIEGVCNYSNGPVCDVFEIFLLNYAGIALRTADLLAEKWTEFHERNKNNPDAKYLQFGHSMGAILIKIGLVKVSKEVRDRVIVVAFAPATIIPDGWCHESYHYASKNDLIPYGEDLYTFIIAACSDEVEQKRLLEQLEKNKQRLILLEPHPDEKGRGHEFQNPTFDKPKKQHIEIYLENRKKQK